MKTIEEIRLANLAALRAGFPSERQFAIRLNKAPNQVNQWFGKGAAREIQSDSAREVEAIMGMPRGWLDNDHSRLLRLDADIISAAIAYARKVSELAMGDPYLVESDPEGFASAIRATLMVALQQEEGGDVVKPRNELARGNGKAGRDRGAKGAPPDGKANQAATGRRRKQVAG